MKQGMVGESKPFLDTLGLIEKICGYDVPVLIEGETGTGKELVARAIHYSSARAARPFIPVNCGAIPDALIENELFGHKRGAFTDASQDRTGLVAHAHKGTLFLDEIDTLSIKAQVTLLRFLQDQYYSPLGGGDNQSGDVRIVAATNSDLTALTNSGTFRLDLFYRIKIMHMRMPPLRERGGDVTILAEHFLRSCGVRFGRTKTLDAQTLKWFQSYPWPGNVRELENLICREYLLADDDVIRIPPPKPLGDSRPGQPSTISESGRVTRFAEAKTRAIEEFERRYVTEALAFADGNVTRAARLAGKERRAFGKLIKKHGILKSQFAL